MAKSSQISTAAGMNALVEDRAVTLFMHYRVISCLKEILRAVKKQHNETANAGASQTHVIQLGVRGHYHRSRPMTSRSGLQYGVHWAGRKTCTILRPVHLIDG